MAHQVVADGTTTAGAAVATKDGTHTVNTAHTANQLLKLLPTKDTIQMPAVVNFDRSN